MKTQTRPRNLISANVWLKESNTQNTHILELSQDTARNDEELMASVYDSEPSKRVDLPKFRIGTAKAWWNYLNSGIWT